MKLGLLHVVGARKATARKQPAFLSHEHKSLQEFGASKFVTKRLETSENMKVSWNKVIQHVTTHQHRVAECIPSFYNK